jgi:hypothetical protein
MGYAGPFWRATGRHCCKCPALKAAGAIVMDIPAEHEGRLQTLVAEAPAPQATS